MCDLATAALVMSTAAGGYGAMQQNAIAKQNAAFATYEAKQTAEIGRANEQRARSRMDRLIARQRAQLSTRGVRLDSASAMDLGEEAGAEAFIEAQSARISTESRVNALTNEAAIMRHEGRVGMLNGMFNTAAKGITGALDLWPELQGA
jgi:hypothetical protein